MIQQLRRLSTLTLFGGALFIAFYLVETLWATGELETLRPGFLGRCDVVTGVTGPEDLTIHPDTGVAYVSAYDRVPEAQGLPVRGEIYAYRPGSGAGLVPLTRDFEGEFRPHGISLYRAPEGRRGEKDRLFVVNHAPSEQRIEIFDVEGKRLVHRETVRDPAFVSPSDVLAVGPRTFYLTNDTGTLPGEWSWYLENLWRFPYANVVYYDGTSAREVADRVAKASGISQSRDGKHVYVAALLGRKIHVYDRDADSGDLTPRDIIVLPTNPDNVEVDQNGWLWVGSHPRLVTLVRHILSGGDGEPIDLAGLRLWDPASLAPSQVVRIKRDPEGGYQLTQIYADEGGEISASSVASHHGRRLLIGSLTDEHILDCRFDPLARDYR